MAITAIAAAIATLEPEMAPNSTQASTVATPKPPGIQPTSESANRNSCPTRPVFSIRKPAKMKRGIAISEYLPMKLKKARKMTVGSSSGSTMM